MCNTCLVVQKPDLEDGVGLDDAIGHVAVASRVAHEDDVVSMGEILKVAGVDGRGLVLVVHVDQLALQPDNLPCLLRQKIES